jgi:hypothetical protein
VKKLYSILLLAVFVTNQANPFIGVFTHPSTSGGGATYNWRETFEGSGYLLTGWTETGTGPVDEDFSTSGLSLEASSCLKVTGTTTESYASRSFTPAVGEGWLVGYFRVPTLPANQVKFLRANGASGATSMFFAYLDQNGKLRVEDQNGSLSAVTSAAVSINTTYKFRFHYKKHATASTCDIEFSTTDFDGAGTDFTAATANGTTNIDGDQIYLYGGKGASTGCVIYFDDVVFDDAVIPFTP